MFCVFFFFSSEIVLLYKHALQFARHSKDKLVTECIKIIVINSGIAMAMLLTSNQGYRLLAILM